MATDYNKILLDKGYTQAQIDAMRGAANAGASNKDIVAAGGTPASTPSKVTTPTTTTTTTKTNNSNVTKANTNIAKPEYQGTGTVNNPTPSYQHQGEGNYVYNPTSGYYEKQSTPATSTSTSTSTPTTGTDKNASAREMWDSKSYQEQQNLLNKSPSLREKVLSIGGTIKTAPEEGTPAKTDTTGTTPSTEWDYQDNSPERMAQMVDNLERIYQSNPGLFDNEQAFRNAFINGVNRSPEQEAFLMDYFKNRQIYNEYDGYTSEKVGYMEAHGQCPQSYLNYVKNSNPQRYAEIMDSKDKTEKGIENDTYYSDLLKNSGFEDSSNLAWQKKEGLLVDENGDKIDDRRYHEMSAEEKQYRDEEATLQSENLKLEEALRNLDEDLIDQYPDADYSTIMLLRSDRGSKIQKQIASNNVTITKLQGMINYMQSERQQQDKAGADTIAQLQKNLGMYYDYTPEGMSELAQAQYAATNVTLDQAENGTDTQKQMALDSVLSDYFDKYGSIIQRSKSQVINDVMNYAKKNGVSLSQALEDNFLSQLRSKPLYSALSNGGLSPNVSFEKVGDTGYVLTVNPDGTYSIETVGGAAGSSYTTNESVAGSQWSNGNQVKLGENATDTGIPNVYGSNVKLAPTVGNMLQKAYDNLKSQGIELQIGDSYRSYETQKKAYEEDQAKPADQRKGVAAPGKSFHELGQAIDVAQNQMNDPKVIQALLDAGFTRPVKSEPRHWSYGEGADAFGGKASNSTPSYTDMLNNKFSSSPDWNTNGYFNSLGRDLEGYIENGKLNIPNDQYKSLKESYGINDQEFRVMAQNYANNELKGAGGDQAARALEMAIKTYEYLYGEGSDEIGLRPNGSTWASRQAGGYMPWTDVGKARTEFESMMNRLTLQELYNAKALGATFGAMSNEEWDVLRNAATDVQRGAGNFKENLEDLIESLYDASKDGNAKLPKNWGGSAAEGMVNQRRGSGTSISNDKTTTTTKSNNKFNTNSFVTEQDDFDSEWGM